MNDTTATNCTCPSGNGSLRHPCPAHIDQRAAGNPAAAQEAAASVISYKPLERTAVITWAHVQNGGDPDWLRCGAKLFAAPVAAAPVDAPSIDDAHAIGANGTQGSEAERLAFEAWMRGHCWALRATWDGKGYVSDAEQAGGYCPHAARTRGLWAAWRDRAALSSTPAAPGIDLREPMRNLYQAYVRLLESGMDRITSLGGDCDPVDVMEANDIDLRAAREALDASPKGGSDAEVMQLRYQLNSLRQLLSGFTVAVQNNPLQPPCTYLEEVRLSHEFQPGEGQKVATALRNALNSEGAKS